MGGVGASRHTVTDLLYTVGGGGRMNLSGRKLWGKGNVGITSSTIHRGKRRVPIPYTLSTHSSSAIFYIIQFS